jgi:hypothetical protein
MPVRNEGLPDARFDHKACRSGKRLLIELQLAVERLNTRFLNHRYRHEKRLTIELPTLSSAAGERPLDERLEVAPRDDDR